MNNSTSPHPLSANFNIFASIFIVRCPLNFLIFKQRYIGERYISEMCFRYNLFSSREILRNCWRHVFPGIYTIDPHAIDTPDHLQTDSSETKFARLLWYMSCLGKHKHKYTNSHVLWFKRCQTECRSDLTILFHL